MPMSPRLLRPLARSGDSDVRAYIAAVEAADQQALEQGVKDAIRDFIVGCKQDGIWSAIKASCILMGARTLSGALTPLVGTAPTNNGPFVSGDYNRKTGLVGNGTSKYLDTNRANNADPQNSNHNALYATVIGSGPALSMVIEAGANHIGGVNFRNRNQTPSSAGDVIMATGFNGHSRNSSAAFSHRKSGATTSHAISSQTPSDKNLTVNSTANTFGTHRLAFYSIGESLDLALLDSRVTTLYNAIGAAIP